MHDLIPLGYLCVGQKGQIGQLVGQPGDVHRLKELGLREGVTVEMVQSGSPCIVQLAGNKLCFRRTDALGVLVHPEEVA